jgi:hypothetical protein
MTLYNRESHLLADEKYQLTRDHTRKLLSCMDANNSLLFVFTSGTNTARKKKSKNGADIKKRWNQTGSGVSTIFGYQESIFTSS